jgi:hypothetical protein
MYVCIYVCIEMTVCLYVCMYVCIYVCIEMTICMNVCIYTLLRVCMNVCTVCLSANGCRGFGDDVVLLLALQLYQREPQPHINLIVMISDRYPQFTSIHPYIHTSYLCIHSLKIL